MADMKPRLLDHVIDAITSLSERQGSNIIKITAIIKKKIEAAGNKPPLRNTVNEIQKAVAYGIKQGFLKKRYNKISLLVKRNNGVKQNKNIIKQNVKPQKKPKRYEKLSMSQSCMSSTGTSISSYTDSLEHYRQNRTGMKSYRRRSLSRKHRRRRSKTPRRRRRRHGRRHMRRRTPTPANFKRAKEHKEQRADVNKKHVLASKHNLRLEPTEDAEPATPDNQNEANPENKVSEPHNPNECDNPKCICKVKNEPDENENDNEFCV